MHMGITRSFNYLLKAANDDAIQLHPKISISLHSFAAKVTRIRYDNKLYMITCPVHSMRNIMLKALPNDVFVGDTHFMALKDYYSNENYKNLRSKQITNEIRTMDGHIMDLKEKNMLEYNLDDMKAEDKSLYFNYKDELQREIKRASEHRRSLYNLEFFHKEEEILSISNDGKLTQDLPPIRRNQKTNFFENNSYKEFILQIQIYDTKREKIIYEYQESTKGNMDGLYLFKQFKTESVVRINDEEYSGNDALSFQWFRHRCMCGPDENPYVTIYLDKLASAEQLE